MPESFDPILPPELDPLLRGLDPQAGAQVAQIVFRELEARKRAEQALRETEERFRAVADHARAAFGILDGTRLVYANPGFAELTGYSVQEIVGMDFRQMTHPSFHQFMIDRARKRLTGEPVPDHYEFLAITKSGQERWIDFSPAITELNGKRVIIGTGFDVTERKRAQEALAESEQRFRAMADGTPLIIWVTDAGGRMQFVNRAWCEFFGTTLEEVQTRGWQQLIHPEDAPACIEAFFTCLRERKAYHSRERVRRHDGEWRWIESYGQPRFSPSGELLGMAGSSPDITERKHAEEAMERARQVAEQAKAQAEEANAAKDHFLAVLSHELRTPLTPVLAMVSILHEDRRFDQDTRDGMDMIRRNVEMEARLIDDLLDMTRIARGKVELHKQQVALCTVIRRAIQVCQADLEGRGLHFGLDLGEAAPYVIEADVGRLQQVFWNLLKNAIKFTAHDGCVGVRCRKESAELKVLSAQETDGSVHPTQHSALSTQHSVVVEVHDSGIGIEPEHLGRIFNAFEQGGRTVTRQFGGLGLGLAISKALLELHGGTIEAHSEGKGKGATFRIRLPLVAAQPRREALSAAPPESRPLRILLVEDHGDTAQIMRRLLMLEGHEVQAAGDVATALELAANHTFDLLISDLGLPDRSGLDLMRELRARGSALPGIALSGYGQEEDLRRSRDAGFAAHLTKPSSPDRLAEAIAAIAGQGLAAPPPSSSPP